jgi:hypothetical protein
VIARDVCLCLVVELGQLLIEGRHAEVHDFAVNAAGLLAGHAMLPVVLGHLRTSAALRHLPAGHTAMRWSILFLCSLFWLAALVFPIRAASLADWDLSYPLLLGNERDGDRQWEGEIKYVALYDRALSPAEIGDPRSRGAAAEVYDFTDAPLIFGPRGIDTRSFPGGSLSSRLEMSGSFSVDVWLKPDSLTLTGPARIVGISESAWRRNFSVAQEAGAIYFRVRNPINGPNGLNHEYRCENVLADAFSRLVVIYDRGAISLNHRPRHRRRSGRAC